tara:strand:- start:1463 stop:2197 length:735 start_codon:yes stop_codon:yes gene_type:complete
MKKVLEDHKLVKKKLQPPIFNSFKGWKSEFIEISYINKIVPEIVWIAYLNNFIRVPKTVELISYLIENINNTKSASEYSQNLFISNYEKINIKEIKTLEGEKFKYLKEQIRSFINIHPECPINKIFNIKPEKPNASEITEYKKILNLLLDKTSILSVHTLSNIVYHLIDNKNLSVGQDSIFVELNKIKDYPKTMFSKKLASSIRASLNPIMCNDNFVLQESQWQKNFWNNTYKLEPYKIENIYF